MVFCLEYDRSTESVDRLGAKRSCYADLQVATGQPYWVLFCFRHRCREAGARRVLANATVTVATATLGPARRPYEAIWTPIGYHGPPMLLGQLARVPLPAESHERLERAREYQHREAIQSPQQSDR